MTSGRRSGGKRLGIALALTLGPILVLAVLGYRIVDDREQSLQLTYSSTTVLVRDRLVSAHSSLEGSLPRRVDVPESPARVQAIQTWLADTAKNSSWIDRLFVMAADDVVISPDACFGCDRLARRRAVAAAESPAIRAGEAAEFQRHDLPQALQLYEQALAQSGTPELRCLSRQRVGRTLNKLNRVEDSIAAYRQLAADGSDCRDAQGVPFVITARAEIADGHLLLGRNTDADRELAEQATLVLQRPWDASGGLAYHARRLARGLGADVARATDLGKLATAADQVEWVASELQPKVRATFAEGVGGRDVHAITVSVQDRPVRVALAPLAIGDEATVSVLAATTNVAYVRQTLLPGALQGVSLDGHSRVELSADAAMPPAFLSSASLGDVMPGWTVAIVDGDGRSLAQLSARSRWIYGAIVGGVLLVLVVGVAFTTRSWAREAELSRVRSEFVSSVSHELKTPLALIRMFGETLESGLVDDPAKQQEFYGIIRRESERLTHLINNVLDTAKIESGTTQFSLRPGDIVALVREALDAYRPFFARLGFEIESRLPGEPVTVSLDRDAVAQALVNLFQNAIRYSGDVKHVSVIVERRTGDVVVSVADRGIGIAGSDLPRIFDKFYRTGTKTGDASAGSGLGLSIVKHIMAVHGGRVEVKSAIGGGSEFALVFPGARSAV